jgi:hypothetical protein
VRCPDPEVTAQLGRFLSLDHVSEQQLALLARTLQRDEPIVDALASRQDSQQTLRTLGAFVDLTGARGAYLSVGPPEVAVQPFGAASTLHLGPLELMAESAARVALRGQGTPAGAAALAHHARLLRRLGGVLNAEEPQGYEVVVLPQLIVVEGQAGYYRVFAPEELEAPAPPDSDPVDG